MSIFLAELNDELSFNYGNNIEIINLIF